MEIQNGPYQHLDVDCVDQCVDGRLVLVAEIHQHSESHWDQLTVIAFDYVNQDNYKFRQMRFLPSYHHTIAELLQSLTIIIKRYSTNTKAGWFLYLFGIPRLLDFNPLGTMCRCGLHNVTGLNIFLL